MKDGTEIVIVDGPLPSGTPSKARYRTARSDGNVVRVRVVEADSPNFTADFEAAFRANVRRVRQDNRALKVK